MRHKVSTLSRALAVSVFVTLVVWLLTLDWSAGPTAPLSLTAPLPGLAAGLAAGAATLLLPAGSGKGKRGRQGPRLRRSLLPVGALGGVLLLGYAGGRVAGWDVAAHVGDWVSGGGARDSRPATSAVADVAQPTVARRPAAAPRPDAGEPTAEPSATATPAPTQAAAAAGATVTTLTVTATPDPSRYLVKDLLYEPYPEVGAAGLTLSFEDRQSQRPVLAYYELVRDASTLTIALSATAGESLDRDYPSGPIRSIRQDMAGGRLRLRVDLAQTGVGIVDDTETSATGLRLFFVPDTGFGSLTHAPTPVTGTITAAESTVQAGSH